MSAQNDNLVLICGQSGEGKSASLMDLHTIGPEEGVLYLNCEAGKKLPFKNNFKSITITDPYSVLAAFDHIKDSPGRYHTVVIDSVTFMMDMFESVHIIGSANTMQGWANYNQFFKTLMQEKVANCSINVIMLAHVLPVFNDERGIYEVKVPVKGSLKNQGVEAYFSSIVMTKKVPLRILDNYKNSMLNVTDEDRLVGYKHVFQTRITKDSVGERTRGPLNMFSVQETYTDNNAGALMKHIQDYYSSP